jgi:hypothetical protein
MSKELQTIKDQYSDLLIRALELTDKTFLTDLLVSIDNVQNLIQQGVVR